MSELKNKKVLLVITGGIAAYKALELIRLLKKKGSSIKTILSKNANKFVTPLSVTALSQEKISTPSHSQVIKPIYKTASYRWRNYRKHLVGFEKRLSPWINEYGY